ncbi:MAG: ATP-binding protein [Desulfuromusa sp.]|nr:ATP-binding protein [Desulfuromusa sp.]
MNLRSNIGLFIVIGFVASIFIFYPVHDFMSYQEYVRGLQVQTYEFNSAIGYVLHKFTKTIMGERLLGSLIFGLVGIIVGLLFYFIFQRFHNHRRMIENLQNEIDRDIVSIIAQGESGRLEFKSSFRWDVKQNGVNKELEGAVLKTIAAFMNTEGGSLLIGVDDEGCPLGLEKDFATLKTKNRDGFEVALMTAIATKLGTPQCARVTILFHKIENRDICHVLVSKSQKAVFLEAGKETKFFLRAGAGTKELNVKEAAEYISDHW